MEIEFYEVSLLMEVIAKVIILRDFVITEIF
jgi:hypothetical protein